MNLRDSSYRLTFVFLDIILLMKNIVKPSKPIANRDSPKKNGASGLNEVGSISLQIMAAIIDVIPAIRNIKPIIFKTFIARGFSYSTRSLTFPLPLLLQAHSRSSLVLYYNYRY